MPQEILDFEVMHEMRWSWAEFQAAPLYVRRYCLDLISIRRRVAAERDDRQRPGGAR